jgi:hypothetical protein
MAGGFPSQSPEPLAPFSDPIAALNERVRRLETPTGTSMTNLVAQVQAALVNLSNQVADLVQQYVTQYTYTRAQVDAKVASPGAISPTTVQASGNIGAQGSLTSNGSISTGANISAQGLVIGVGSHNFNVSTNYVACWINGDGTFGTSASTLRVKRDLEPMGPNVAEAILSLVPRWGHYIWDPEDDDSPKAFLIAEEVDELGIFGEDVLVRDEDDLPLSINYSQLVPALIATLQALDGRLRALEGSAGS